EEEEEEEEAARGREDTARAQVCAAGGGPSQSQSPAIRRAARRRVFRRSWAPRAAIQHLIGEHIVLVCLCASHLTLVCHPCVVVAATALLCLLAPPPTASTAKAERLCAGARSRRRVRFSCPSEALNSARSTLSAPLTSAVFHEHPLRTGGIWQPINQWNPLMREDKPQVDQLGQASVGWSLLAGTRQAR
ncbi:unnamed protein product, partial [Prorocentrum cordatum]